MVFSFILVSDLTIKGQVSARSIPNLDMPPHYLYKFLVMSCHPNNKREKERTTSSLHPTPSFLKNLHGLLNNPNFTSALNQ